MRDISYNRYWEQILRKTT